MARDQHQLTTVVVGDEPDGWATAGFTLHDDRVRISSTTIVCDPSVGQGIAVVGINSLTDTVDGLPIGLVDAPVTPATEHHNRVTGFDHLVAVSPSIDRTADALIDAGLQRRRTRRFEMGGETRRQDFFRLGDVILELVGIDGAKGAGDAAFWGLALECDDLDLAASRLGQALGTVKDAVQPGRRIATVRTKELGISVPIALMSPHHRR
ncbi:MAG: glyoxalase [Acidimicrobiaceae bacterium]|nr:glyoxalase [Acidimicrobiaceae bacterium]HAB57889.1 glyoxalase [Acidimicrobiaceae bacterium]